MTTAPHLYPSKAEQDDFTIRDLTHALSQAIKRRDELQRDNDLFSQIVLKNDKQIVSLRRQRTGALLALCVVLLLIFAGLLPR